MILLVLGDLSEIFCEQIDGYSALVVEDEGSLTQIKRLNLPEENNYFNAGVMMFNLQELRKFDFKNECMNFYRNNKEIICLEDQDVLNCILNGKCKFVSLRYNANNRIFTGNELENFYTEEEIKEAEQNPVILHFTDCIKPWNENCIHPMKNEYYRYWLNSPWKQKYYFYLIKSIFYQIKMQKKKIISLKINKNEISLKIFSHNVIQNILIHKIRKNVSWRNFIMNANPKISVVMSCYNRESYVRDAIESILNQTYTDFEFIIIDDCSTDKTPEIIQEYADKDNRIIFIRNQENMDYNYNLRKGFKIAKGEYIARMDDDDISLPERFEKQVSYLDQHPDITVLGTFIKTFGELEIESWITETDSDVLNVLMNFHNPMCHPSVMIRKSFLQEHDLTYSPKELYAEEYDLWKNIILNGGKLANLPEELVRYRTHKNNISQVRWNIQQETAYRVSKQLLTRFFNDKEYKRIKDKFVMYPFECNNKKLLWQTLESMKARNNGELSNDAIEYVKSKYCGIPSDMHIFFAKITNLHNTYVWQ